MEGYCRFLQEKVKVTFQTLDSLQNVLSPSPSPHSSVELSDLIQGQKNDRVQLPLPLTFIFIPTMD